MARTLKRNLVHQPYGVKRRGYLPCYSQREIVENIQALARAVKNSGRGVIALEMPVVQRIPLSQRSDQLDKVFAEGASSLLARATESHSLTPGILTPRIKATVEKYVLRDEPDASLDSIVDFIDKLQADDLCLIVACELGNQTAWSDLVERFSATVRSLRSASIRACSATSTTTWRAR